MFGKSLRAIPGATSARAAWALGLCLFSPAWSLAQPPQPPLPETTPAQAAPSGTPGYDAPESPADTVKSRELLRFEGMVRGDLGVLDRLLGEDLTYTHSNGEVDTKARFLEKLQTGKLRYLVLTPGDIAVRMVGEAAAVVTGRIEIKAMSDGKELSFPARFLSVYARRHGGWLLVAWQSTRLGP